VTALQHSGGFKVWGATTTGSHDYKENYTLRARQKRAAMSRDIARSVRFDRHKSCSQFWIIVCRTEGKMTRPSLWTELVDKHLPNACGKHRKDVIGRY
jgi:hypothetical protein